jgi:hypothetical protein
LNFQTKENKDFVWNTGSSIYPLNYWF